MTYPDSFDFQDIHTKEEKKEEDVQSNLRINSKIERSAPSPSGSKKNLSISERRTSTSAQRLQPDELLNKTSSLQTSVEERLEANPKESFPPVTRSENTNLVEPSSSTNVDETIPIDGEERKQSIGSFQNSEKESIPAFIKKKIEKDDPVALGKSLYREELPGFTSSIVCPIIGANDEFHKKTLVAYMDCFDFSGVSLDEAFRRFCFHVQLSGETQAIDRIVYQLSLRYWNCNPDIAALYKSVDIVYGTLFSIVLLNTDMHTVNVGTKGHKKMTLRDFLRNNMSLFDDMICKDIKIASQIETNPEAWKKDFEIVLKDIYTSVLENPIMQKSSIISPQHQNSTTTSNPSANNQKSTSRLLLGSISPNSFNFLKRDNSRNFHPSNNQIVIEGVLIRKHMVADGGERASNRRWMKVWSCIRISKDMGVELHTHRVSHMVATEREFVESERNTPIQYSDISKYPACSSGGSLPSALYSSTLIDKQASPLGLEQTLTLSISIGKRFNGSTNDSETPSSAVENVIIASTMSPQTIGPSGSVHTPSHPVLSPRNTDYKLSSNNDVEVMSLIHAFASPHYYNGPGREHCFSIQFNNNHVYLFQCPSEVAQEAWIKTINYWAALKSKEPMRGGISNLDYGWSLSKKSSNPDLSSLAIISPKNRTESKSDSPTSSKLKKSDSSHSLNQNQPNSLSPSWGKKIAKWTPEIVSTRLVSNKDELEQLQCMIRQLDYVKGEIAAHEDLKHNLDNPQAQFHLVLMNWNAKCDALNHEYLKYESYIVSLRSVVEGEPGSDSITVPTNSPSSQLQHQLNNSNDIITKEESLFGFSTKGIL